MSAATGATLGVCRIPLALLLSAPTTVAPINSNSSLPPEMAEVQKVRGTADCVNDAGIVGHVAFKLQLKRLPLSYTTPVKQAQDISAAASARKQQSQAADGGKERLLQVATIL